MTSSARVPGFMPSRNGFHFTNSFPTEPAIEVDVVPFGQIALGDASNGLCGGMVFAVRDLFQAGILPPADVSPPAPATPLFRYIVSRLIDSFGLPHAGFMKYYDWMITPDADTGWPPFFVRPGIARKTIVDEWATRIRPELDAGRLCSLGLVTTSSTNPADLGKNHQVLAYGYDIDDANRLDLLVYDPNTSASGADKVRISLGIAYPARATPITHNVAIGEAIRGFFRVDYSPHDPSAIGAAHPAALAGGAG